MQIELTQIVSKLIIAATDLSGLDAVDFAAVKLDALDLAAQATPSNAFAKNPERLSAERYAACVALAPGAALKFDAENLSKNKELFQAAIEANPGQALLTADAFLSPEQKTLCEGLLNPTPISKEEQAVLTLDIPKLYAALGIEKIKKDLGLVDKADATLDPEPVVEEIKP